MPPLEGVCQAFVEKVREIPAVREVRVLRGEPSAPPIVCTVLSSPLPDASVRTQVYQAEYEVLKAFNYPAVIFRLLNVQEERAGTTRAKAPSSGSVLWKR